MKLRRSRTRKLGCEALEGRLLLSAMPALSRAAVLPLFGQEQSAAVTAKSGLKAAPIATASSNWSGYAVTGANGSVSYVAGSWVVPAVNTATSGYSAVWVGIDGYSSNTVEQTGTEEDVVGGRASYSAWYEVYPSYSVTINSMTVKANDSMTASVSYVAATNKFTLTIKDVTENESYSISLAAKGAARSSAEWVVEAPSSGYGELALANFAAAKFTNAYATIGGVTGAIDNWQSYSITMEPSRSVTATPSGLTDSAASSLPTGGTSTYSGEVSSFSVVYSGSTSTTGGGGGGGRSGHGRGGPGGWGGQGWFSSNLASQVASQSGGSSQSASLADFLARDQLFASTDTFSPLGLRV